MDPITSAALKPIIDETAKKTIGGAFDFLAKKYHLLEILKFKKNYLEYCEKILQVKTLVSSDRVFHIDDIYVNVDLLPSGSQLRIPITDSTTLDNDKALLIKGLAGQGKSTLLRKLLSNNAKRFHRLPIFYELKNYTGGRIEQEITISLNNAGVKIKEHALSKLLLDSNVKVYLDAFDETKPEFRNQLLDQIRRLVNSFKCHVICTSRPDTEIDTLSEFETYSVCELTEQQIFGIIKNTASDNEKSSELCEALTHSPLHSKQDSILKSPILVVLFCISYNLGEQIPTTLSQFYSNIFDTVFHRHDNIKGKVNRQRHWNDNRRIYRDLFNCLCFISLRSGAISFKKDILTGFVSHSLTHVGEDNNIADKIAMELSTITNLIIEDGFNEYRYVHKSIQEFFAASFILSLEHHKKIGFYNKCFNEHSFYIIFHNVLFFLEELDYHDYFNYGFIPAVKDMFSLGHELNIEEISIPQKIEDTFLDNTFMKARISIFKTKGNESFDVEINNFAFESELSPPSLYVTVFNFCLEQLKIEFSDKELADLILNTGKKTDDGWHKFSLRTVLMKKRIPLSRIQELLLLSFDVLIRRKLALANEKIKSRKVSLDDTEFFDF
ncbi:TPA: NACHT domain-containing NTPase [Enterobacter roggenkampii]|uniref:NACHT domain-containing protein n=1 Tax=Enterobacter roggenkampii TaxID=1812935 RepID=UPI00094478A8|nr:NACHT domain-containing protein [Enterobacter roggenkampii]MCK7254336.1 NACHT domain-containing protein [Enterobacter roggenkampii]MEB6115891.1 NACHT domain-containing protein [Enterobacter roggenkampii]UWI98562.1 NACHT domain-containing protein [Enterobacter roggenkampii]